MFGKGREVKRLPNSRDILSHITDLDIFDLYLGGIPSKAISSPLREDTSPSFSLFMSREHGRVFFKDFATGESGDCFLFVMRLFKFSTKSETFLKIARDFNLTDYELNPNSLHTPPILNTAKLKRNIKKIKTNKLKISVTVRDWLLKDKNYWYNKYSLSKAQLEYCKIFPISHFFINGFCTKAKDLAYAFVEGKDGSQTFKIYQPYADKENKWFNNNDYSTWELWTQLPETGNNLIITSSRKDAVVIKSLFQSQYITSCSLQNEGIKPKQNVIDELKSRFKRIFVMYDNDFESEKNTGRIAGAKIANAAGFIQIEIPDGCGVKDPSDYIEAFGAPALTRLILGLVNKDS